MKTCIYANEKQSFPDTYFASLLGSPPSSETGLPFGTDHVGLDPIAQTVVHCCGNWFFSLILL